MSTFDQITDRVKRQLLGYTANQLSVSALAEAMTASDTEFIAEDDTVENLSRGLVEIDDELILVKRFDPSAGSISVMGGINGRGYNGTTAATHAVGALVTAAPPFPRHDIKQAINDAVLGLYPALVVFETTEITRVSTQLEYELPADATDVWSLHGETVGPTKVWRPLPNHRFNPDASPTDFPTGKSVQQLDFVTPGEKVRIVYTKAPVAMSGGADDFETVTGYPERIEDLVSYGALMRLLPALAPAYMQMQSVESGQRARLVNDSSPAKAVQLYSALYETRLEDERNRQFTDRPVASYYQGS